MDSEDSFNNFLGEAISDVENLRHMQFRRKQNETRKKGPRSLGPKVLAMKLNHLPEASQMPFFLFSFCFRRNCMCLKFSTSEIASPRKLLKLSSLSIFKKVNKID